MQVLLDIGQFIVYSATFFILGVFAVTIGVKNGLILFTSNFVPLFLEALNKEVKAQSTQSQPNSISEEETNKILRRMRGEK